MRAGIMFTISRQFVKVDLNIFIFSTPLLAKCSPSLYISWPLHTLSFKAILKFWKISHAPLNIKLCESTKVSMITPKKLPF